MSPNVSPNVDPQGVQNGTQLGTGNQQSQQYGSDNVNRQNGGTARNEHNRQWGNAAGGASAQGDEERHDNGLHKGWSKNGKQDKKEMKDKDRDNDRS